MPTGVALGDAREQLFDAAERILARDGASALTSRSVTDEAGCAKGVLHRHFVDFDGFLAELVVSRIERLQGLSIVLLDAAGTGSVTGNLADLLTELFDPVAVAIVALITFRATLRERLRVRTSVGVPLMQEATAVVAEYLTIERNLGRVAVGAEIDALAPAVVGTGHLLFADRSSGPVGSDEVRFSIEAVLGGVVR